MVEIININDDDNNDNDLENAMDNIIVIAEWLSTVKYSRLYSKYSQSSFSIEFLT